MKKKNLLLMLLAVMALLLIPVSVQAAAKKPGTVKLSSIKAVDYNKINIKWKKPSGKFTNYCIYYREKDTNGKWIKIKTVNNKTLSYTHTSSAKYPIVTGETYQYTVRAYNKKTKQYGNYNKSGLTTKTRPQQVKLTGISYDEDEGVTITWNKAGGAYLYRIYCKSKDNTKWLSCGQTRNLEFTDADPYTGRTNIYTVKAVAANETAGKFDTTGLSIAVPSDGEGDVDSVTPTPALTMQQMADEVVRLANIERAKIGSPPLKVHPNLQKAAMLRAQEVSVKFSHIRPNGTDASTACYEAGVGCVGLENIAKGYSTPQDVMNGWMNSLGHRTAILESYASYVGVGVYKTGNDLYCWTMEFSSGPDEKRILTIDANGGTFEDGSTVKKIEFPCNITIDFNKDIPLPKKNGYTLSSKWQCYSVAIPGATLGDNETIKAIWIPNS